MGYIWKARVATKMDSKMKIQLGMQLWIRKSTIKVSQAGHVASITRGEQALLPCLASME